MTVYELHCDYRNDCSDEMYYHDHFSVGFYSSREKAEKALQEYDPMLFVKRILHLVHWLDDVVIKEDNRNPKYKRYYIKTYLTEEYILDLEIVKHPLDPSPEA